MDYETCQIDVVIDDLGEKFKFRANAIGPKGAFVAGETQWMTLVDLENCTYPEPPSQARLEFVTWLVQHDWAPLKEKGELWYQTRLRRSKRKKLFGFL